MSAVATNTTEDHPLTTEKDDVRRAAVVIITSDRGLAGAYSSSVIKESERLVALLREEGKEVVPYLLGRKVIGFYRFRHRETAAEWSGNSEKPSFETAREVGERLVADFTTPTEEGGIDEVHIVFSRFVSMVTQEPEVIRLLPLEIVEGTEAPSEGDLFPLYEFEPTVEEVLDALSDSTRTLLLRMSALDVMTAELVDHVAALLLAARDPHGAAALDLGDLADDAAHRARRT